MCTCLCVSLLHNDVHKVTGGAVHYDVLCAESCFKGKDRLAITYSTVCVWICNVDYSIHHDSMVVPVLSRAVF